MVSHYRIPLIKANNHQLVNYQKLVSTCLELLERSASSKCAQISPISEGMEVSSYQFQSKTIVRIMLIPSKYFFHQRNNKTTSKKQWFKQELSRCRCLQYGFESCLMQDFQINILFLPSHYWDIVLMLCPWAKHLTLKCFN